MIVGRAALRAVALSIRRPGCRSSARRRDEATRLFLRIKGHPQDLPVSRAYVHLFKSM
jgi:hypothetical protein